MLVWMRYILLSIRFKRHIMADLSDGSLWVMDNIFRAIIFYASCAKYKVNIIHETALLSCDVHGPCAWLMVCTEAVCDQCYVSMGNQTQISVCRNFFFSDITPVVAPAPPWNKQQNNNQMHYVATIIKFTLLVLYLPIYCNSVVDNVPTGEI